MLKFLTTVFYFIFITIFDDTVVSNNDDFIRRFHMQVLVHGEQNEMSRLKAALIREYEDDTEYQMNVHNPKNTVAVELHFRGEKMAKVFLDFQITCENITLVPHPTFPSWRFRLSKLIFFNWKNISLFLQLNCAVIILCWDILSAWKTCIYAKHSDRQNSFLIYISTNFSQLLVAELDVFGSICFIGCRKSSSRKTKTGSTNLRDTSETEL